MPVIYRKYGNIVEITEIEQAPNKVRIYAARERRDIYGPRRSDNLRRTRQICVRRLLSAIEEFGKPLLFTLTFEGDASDAAYASDMLRRFQVRLLRFFPAAESLFIPELSPRGRIHFHGLVFNVPMYFGDTRQGGRTVAYGTERSARVFAGLWASGFVDVVQTDGSDRLAYYLAKYVTKAAGEVMFNAMHLLRISQGFPREIIVRGGMAEVLQQRFLARETFDEWEGDSLFLGHITKKRYEL